MDLDKYKTYTVDDFILDDYLRKIVSGDISQDMINEFINKLPEKAGEIYIAQQVIKNLQSIKNTQSQQRKDQLWKLVLNKSIKHE